MTGAYVTFISGAVLGFVLGIIVAAILVAGGRPQGKWLHRRIIAKDRSFDMVVCSNCQTEFSWDAETGVSMDNYKTCPQCGADMRDGAE